MKFLHAMGEFHSMAQRAALAAKKEIAILELLK